MRWAGPKKAAAYPRAPAGLSCLRSHCLGWWGHTGRERSWDGVRRDRGSPDCGCATSRQPTAMAAPPWPGVRFVPMWALSPHGQDEHGQPAWKGSSVVWVHASNAGCFWGTEVPGCCFWLACEVLCGTIKMLTGFCLQWYKDAEAEVVGAGWRPGAGDPWLGESGRETISWGNPAAEPGGSSSTASEPPPHAGSPHPGQDLSSGRAGLLRHAFGNASTRQRLWENGNIPSNGEP